MSPQDERKQTPLHLAAFYGRLDVAKVLCDAGADLEARSGYHRHTPLISVLNSRSDVKGVKYLTA